MKTDLKIDEEFKTLIPPLATEEYKGLEESIVNEGCRDPLVVWDDTILDGHNRYEICMKHGLIFSKIEKNFDNKDLAKLWILKNQFGRRNLTDGWKIELKIKEKELLIDLGKKTQGKRTDLLSDSDKKLPAHNTRKIIAKELCWSEGKVAEAEVVKKEDPILWEDVKKGKSIDGAYRELKKQKKEKQLEIIKENRLKETKNSLSEKPKVSLESYETWIDKMPDCDMLLTDPVYSTEVDDIVSFVNDWLYKALYKVKPTGSAYIFIGAYPEEVKAYLNAKIPDHINLEQILIWTYKNTLGNNPKDSYKQNYQMCLYYRGAEAKELNIDLTSEQWAVQEINAPDGRQGDRFHQWQKPIEIAERFIRHSTKENDVVLDPFVCTGTFIIAANKWGRQGYGCDISKEALDIAVSRGCELVE